METKAMSPPAEKIEVEIKDGLDDTHASGRLNARVEGYLSYWTANCVLDESPGQDATPTTLDMLRDQTKLGAVGAHDRAAAAVVVNAIGEQPKTIKKIEELITDTHKVIKSVDPTISTKSVVESFANACKEVAGSPEEVLQEIQNADPEVGLEVVEDLFKERIPETRSPEVRITNIKRVMGKSSIKPSVAIAA